MQVLLSFYYIHGCFFLVDFVKLLYQVCASLAPVGVPFGALWLLRGSLAPLPILGPGLSRPLDASGASVVVFWVTFWSHLSAHEHAGVAMKVVLIALG